MLHYLCDGRYKLLGQLSMIEGKFHDYFGVEVNVETGLGAWMYKTMVLKKAS